MASSSLTAVQGPAPCFRFWSRMIALWITATAVKLLLLPAYHSTDLLVHRHWKAVTASTSTSGSTSGSSLWYFDDELVPNRHTLDYPPGFAWWEKAWGTFLLPPTRFEALWSVTGGASRFMGVPPPSSSSSSSSSKKRRSNDDDDPASRWTEYCLQLYPSDDYSLPPPPPPLPDDSLVSDKTTTTTTTTTIIPNNDVQLIQRFPACKAYMRWTVILSDIVLWYGAWQLVAAALPTTTTRTTTTSSSSTTVQQQQRQQWTTFGLLVGHPALLWLDHVHFQYNGFLLGIWMSSLACLVQGRQKRRTTITSQSTLSQSTTTCACTSSSWWWWWWDVYHLGAAVCFAVLLTLKHLYLPLSLWYVVYLFRAYCCCCCCFCNTTNNNNNTMLRLHWTRFFVLAVVTVTTLALPVLPLLWTTTDDGYTPRQLATRIWARLFPWERGLVHDYWAGNLWALYVAVQKVLRATTTAMTTGFWVLPTVSPAVAAVVMILAVTPGAVGGAYMAAAVNVPTNSNNNHNNNNNKPNCSDTQFWMSITWTTLASFATAYHGHEKAIVTSLIPVTLWTMTQPSPQHWVWRIHAFALVSLLPLLYPATETLMKISSMVLYLAVLYQVIVVEKTKPENNNDDNDDNDDNSKKTSNYQDRLVWMDRTLTYICICGLVMTVLLLEAVPLSWWGRFSFAPLALTSLVSATGLSLLTWGHVGWILWKSRAAHPANNVDN